MFHYKLKEANYILDTLCSQTLPRQLIILCVSCEDHQRKSLEVVINQTKHSTELEFLKWCQKPLWKFAMTTDEKLSA